MKKWIAMLLVLCCTLLVIGCGNAAGGEPEITLYEVGAGCYTIGIKDAGYHRKYPLMMDVHFSVDEEQMILQDSKETDLGDAGKNAEFDSVTVYMNDESEATKFVWIMIHGVRINSAEGDFLRREPFVYELSFRIDTGTKEVFDVSKTTPD